MTFILSAFGIGFIFLGISARSLYLAYEKYSSNIWKTTFYGRDGFWLEFNRSWILIGISLYLLVYVFGTETREFFHLDIPTKTEYSFLNISYFVTIIVFVISLSVLVWNHFSKGPNFLKDKDKEELRPAKTGSYWERFKNRSNVNESNSYFNSYEYPYLCYLPYSAINFLLLALSDFSISFYAFLKNQDSLNYLKSEVIRVLDSIHSIAQAHAHSIPSDFPELEKFSQQFITVAGKYSSLFLCISIILFFEIFLFQKTLSDVGRSGTYWAYFLITAIWIIIIIVGFIYYDEIYIKFAQKINELRILNESSSLLERYISINIFRIMIDRYFVFYPTFIILLLLAIKILRNIGALW